MNIFKNISFAALLILVALVACSSGQTTFSGSKADWGVSHTSTNQQVIQFLQLNWKEGNQLSLQSEIDKSGLDCEFLWKVESNQMDKALASGSSFMTGEKADSITLIFYPNGKGEITLYLQGKTVGKVRCWTSSKREGAKYTQLAEGQYKILGKQSKGWSTEFGCAMPNKITLDGVAKTRGITIHTGDISGEKPEINEYHGCIRVSGLSGRQFMKILPDGITVKVVWK